MNTTGILPFLACTAGFVLTSFPGQASETRWRIHEWGTFTSLQDEAGRTIGGINTDDEPVPAFVHRLPNTQLISPSELPPIFFKGIPACHRDVTMRLETPVIYFHPPDAASTYTANVDVKFRGGWLTEFYPKANAEAPGVEAKLGRFGRIDGTTIGRLQWNGLKIGGDWPLRKTSDRVWTAPRDVTAASVQAGNGESEKFLFYRGVGHLDAPLTISRDAVTDALVIRGNLDPAVSASPLTIGPAWLVDIRADGEAAFRPLPAMTLQPGSKRFLARSAGTFEPRDYSGGNIRKMRSELLRALTAEGLFNDEAKALLNTWELSYFKSPGMRVFFLVPRQWTDFYLPLEVSLPADVTRVMVGRIELVAPPQREKLNTLARLTPEAVIRDIGTLQTNYMNIMAKQNSAQAFRAVSAGTRPLASFMPVPASYKTYLELGRFRQALILNHATRSPSPGLDRFIASYGLRSQAPDPLTPAGDPELPASVAAN